MQAVSDKGYFYILTILDWVRGQNDSYIGHFLKSKTWD